MKWNWTCCLYEVFVLSSQSRVKRSYHSEPLGHVEESHLGKEEETECLTAVNLPFWANQFVYQINHLITICICLYGWHCQKRSSGSYCRPWKGSLNINLASGENRPPICLSHLTHFFPLLWLPSSDLRAWLPFAKPSLLTVCVREREWERRRKSGSIVRVLCTMALV